MTVIVTRPLGDGEPIVPYCRIADEAGRRWKERHVARMAKLLLDNGTYRNRDDAVLTLAWAGYAPFDVMAMVDQAIYVATQDVVAKEMGES